MIADIAVLRPQALPAHVVLQELDSSLLGLSGDDVALRRQHFGFNRLPQVPSPTLLVTFVRQFKSPLVYVLLLASLLSLFLGEGGDAGFIFGVLLMNASIGTYQEYRAERSTLALQGLIALKAQVIRGGDVLEIDAKQLVPGDIVLLESGSRVPADMRLLSQRNVTVDESLITGESLAVMKDADLVLAADVALADRINMLFAGTWVNSGRARGVVTAIGGQTELGKIALTVLGRTPTKAPLILRMERFTRRISLVIGLAALMLVIVSLVRGASLTDVLPLAVAMAVSAIPEGLPVALTVALAVGMERMAQRGAIVRRLVAVEALGSCTYIASDKTGTLTLNQLTVRQVQFPHQAPWTVSGEGLNPVGEIKPQAGVTQAQALWLIASLAKAAVLANEATLAKLDGQWVGHGDGVDLALLVLAHKAGLTRAQCLAESPEIAVIPYESERRFAASANRCKGLIDHVFVKGALETLLPMCVSMRTLQGDTALDSDHIGKQALDLAKDGYRVIAVASGSIDLSANVSLSEDRLTGLCLLGLVALSDPPRAEARKAIADCRKAGISVGMITGDHPVTALAVARDVGLAVDLREVTTGEDLARAARDGPRAFESLCAHSHVFARVEPQQKLLIVEALQRQGHFVAVTGDGANDAPALRAAHVGVSMGRRGADVARETSDIVLTDDNFASIVAGVEEGRIAYANVRKVIFLLISTGAAELVLFALALFSGLPMPLLAVQLLWLNLVTNGIQDVALAFEPAEGRELKRPPRPPSQGIFDRVMVERVVLSAVVMGVIGFGAYQWMLKNGYSIEQARNSVLLLMVLFENLQALNSRSETVSVLRQNPFGNKLLLASVVAAQLTHVLAMYLPGLNGVLGVEPVSPGHWLELLGCAATLLAAMEVYKWYRRQFPV